MIKEYQKEQQQLKSRLKDKLIEINQLTTQILEEKKKYLSLKNSVKYMVPSSSVSSSNNPLDTPIINKNLSKDLSFDSSEKVSENKKRKETNVDSPEKRPKTTNPPEIIEDNRSEDSKENVNIQPHPNPFQFHPNNNFMYQPHYFNNFYKMPQNFVPGRVNPPVFGSHPYSNIYPIQMSNNPYFQNDSNKDKDDEKEK